MTAVNPKVHGAVGGQLALSDYAVAAMQLMAEALADLPDRQQAAAQCRALAQKLAARRPPATDKPTSKARPARAPSQPLALAPLEDEPGPTVNASKELPPIEFVPAK